jgi:RNA polymerase sigma-70 factor (TIGR02960 family)
VSDELVASAVRGDQDAFRSLTERYRRELHFHCYRMLGSMHDAEDAVQETMLAAWRGLDGFEGRASVRAWLYRIATNRCLDIVREAGRRPSPPPAVLFDPPPPTRINELTWIEPYPDALLFGLSDQEPGPEGLHEARETIELAFIVALQALPPRQRSALILRDVLGFRAVEVAAMLDSTEDAVKSALKRARATLDQNHLGHDRDRPPQADSVAEHELVQRFADAWETDDIAAIVSLLTDDARLNMPPSPLEYHGAAAISAFLETLVAWHQPQRLRLIPTRANTQPAFGVYSPDPGSPVAHARGLLVVTLAADRICGVTQFLVPSLLTEFGLPLTLNTGAVQTPNRRDPRHDTCL